MNHAFTQATEPKGRASAFYPHGFRTKLTNIGGRIPSTVFISPDALTRMWYFVDMAEQEVGWLGTVSVLPSGDLLIEEVFLLDQEVTPAETDLSAKGIDALGQTLLARPDGVDVANRLLLWGHSHVRMQTNPSLQDEKQMALFLENGCPFTVRAILNKLGRIEITVFLWELGIKVQDIPWQIYPVDDPVLREEIAADFAAKVHSGFKPRKFFGKEP